MNLPVIPPKLAMPTGNGVQRMVALDIVRGVAVLGIVFANIIAMGQPFLAYLWPGGFLTPPTPLDDLLWSLQFVLVDGKFRGLFTLLFGAGMVLFYRRAIAKGAGGTLLARRLAWLGLFGLAHWALLYRGDILLTYAVAGLATIWAVDWPWARQLIVGFAGYAWGAFIGVSGFAPLAWVAAETGPGNSLDREMLDDVKLDALSHAAVETRLRMEGSYGDLLWHNLTEHLPEIPGDLLLVLPETIPLTLIGMGLLGSGIFSENARTGQIRLAGWALWIGGILGASLIVQWATIGGLSYWDSIIAYNAWLPIPQLFSTLGMFALLMVWGARVRGGLADRLAAAGRCAFTNYVGTSFVALLLFSNWGAGWFGVLNRIELYAVAAGFGVAMLAWPPLWLANFRYGPLEWLWRCLTYRRLLTNRRRGLDIDSDSQ